jgi:hypothetical protein
MTAPPFGFQQQINSELLSQLAHSGDNSGWGPVVNELMGSVQKGTENYRKKQLLNKLAMAMQNYGQPQQGPPAPAGPPIQGPQGYAPPNQGPNSSAIPAGQTPMQQNPTSGIGAPTGQGSSEIMGLLMQANPEMAQKLVAAKMGLGQEPMNPLQQSEIVKNEALAKKLGMPTQPRPTNPIDDALKMQRIKALQALMARQSQPKPPNPVPAAALDVRTQIANNAQAPWWKKLGFGGGLKPVTNPLKGQSVPSAISDMTDEQLLQLAGQDDSGQ